MWVFKFCWYLLILSLAITVYAPVSAFASLIGVLVRFTSSAAGIKICVITKVIKNYRSIIKKNNKKHDKIVLLKKSWVRYYWSSNLWGFSWQIFSVNNMLRE